MLKSVVKHALVVLGSSILAAFLVFGCEKKVTDPSKSEGDHTPPSITDLIATNATTTTIDLQWTAPGDSGNVGIAKEYDVRYSTSTISDNNWGLATRFNSVHSPKSANSPETLTVVGLDSDIRYYFAIKTASRASKWSGISNLAHAMTPKLDADAPAAITDLSAGRPTSTTSITLTWTAPGAIGMVGTASRYDVRYSTSEITEANCGEATRFPYSRYPLPALRAETLSVTGLGAGMTYWFVIKTTNSSSKTSDLSNVPAWTTLNMTTGHWEPLGDGTRNREYGPLEIYDGKLIAEELSTAGNTGVAAITAWDGAVWSPLGTVKNGVVLTMAIYDNKLIVGGIFDSIGGVAAKNTAAWDGHTWSALGEGTNYIVSSLAAYEGRLIVGGAFNTAGGISVNGTAAWDGKSWASVGCNLQSPLFTALAVYNYRLIASVIYSNKGEFFAWNGTDWSPINNYYGATASSYNHFTVYDNELIVGDQGGIHAWNGSAWSQICSGMGAGSARALTVFDGKLIAAGKFTAASGITVNNIAMWDGKDWFPLGTGMDDAVEDLAVYGDQLVAAGSFTTAGGVLAKGIAVWKK